MGRFPKNYNFFKHNVNSAKRSFQNIIPKSIRFARAGFYYLNGRIHCCACSLKLHNWFKIGNPMIAHAILSPNCPFLLREKGSLFVHNITQTYLADWDDETLTCKICYTNYIENFLDCGHVFCSTCLKKLKSCPLCQKPIERYAIGSPLV